MSAGGSGSIQQGSIQTGHHGSSIVRERPQSSKAFQRSVQKQAIPNRLPPPPPHGRLQQSLPSDTTVHERKREAVVGKKHIGTELSSSVNPAKETTERNFKQKVAHVFGELKRFFKDENWKPVPKELIDGVNDEELRKDLTARNGKVEELAQLKEKANELEKKLDEFDKKYEKALELYDSVAVPPKKGKYRAPNGKTYDFSKAEHYGDRRDMLRKFKEAFDKDSGFQSYDADRKELSRIRGSEDEPGRRAQLKEEIKELSQSLKTRADEAAAKEAEFRHKKLDHKVDTLQRKVESEVRQKWTEYRAQVKSLGETVVAKKQELNTQKIAHEHRKDLEIPVLKAKLKGIRKMKRQRLGEIDHNKRLSPDQKQEAKVRVEASFKQLRERLEGELSSLEGKVESYSSDRKALKKKYHDAVDAQAKASKGKDFRKGVEDIRKAQAKEEKEALKQHRAVPKEVEQERAAIKKGLQGRMH